MKDFKRILVILLAITILLAAGCTQSQPTADLPLNKGNSNSTIEVSNENDSQLNSLSLFNDYVENGVITAEQAEQLQKYLEENKPNHGSTPSNSTNGEGMKKSNPLADAVDTGIITQEQATAMQDILEQLGPNDIKQQPNQGETSHQPQDGQQEQSDKNQLSSGDQHEQSNTDQAPHEGNRPSSGTSLSISDANDIESKLLSAVGYTSQAGGYPIVDTNVTTFYSNSDTISAPSEGQSFYGQDASYSTNQCSYTDNGDGTITDNVTGLMWQQNPGTKMTWSQAVENLETFSLAGYADWRLPSIKELYSIVQFSGNTKLTGDGEPYLDTDYFVFSYGDTSNGERSIDSQMATSTIYDSATMGGNSTVFGFNFADGRIKGYPTKMEFYVYYVRGNTSYGQNRFVDNDDGTISDLATGLMWMTYDSAYYSAGESGDAGMDWEESLQWCESLDFAGYSDWKLPDAKELQSIVDYTRSPDTTNSAAIDELFYASQITNVFGVADYGYYWTSTTHLDGRDYGANAVYMAFGRGNGNMNGNNMDVHGAGCQRSDPKTGNSEDYPYINDHAPQGDEQRVFNLVRAVRIIED